jgi:hypothetical protein
MAREILSKRNFVDFAVKSVSDDINEIDGFFAPRA